MDKSHLRKRIRQLLPTISTLKSQSEAITEHILQLDMLPNSTGVSIYLSRPLQEVQTGKLIRELQKRKIRIFAPYIIVDKRNKMEMLEISNKENIDEFEKDLWGIPVLSKPELRTKAKATDLDMVITPAVAFDKGGNRLGNGLGFYDTFFTEIDAERSVLGLPKVIKIGVALKEMIVDDDLPSEPHDVKMDQIITADGNIL